MESSIFIQPLSLRTSAAREAICQALSVIASSCLLAMTADCFVVPPRNDRTIEQNVVLKKIDILVKFKTRYSKPKT